MERDNLQAVVNDIRAELKKHRQGSFRIAHPLLKEPMLLDVVPDGITAWFVKLTCGERILVDIHGGVCVHPDEFVSDLYVILRSAICVLTTPPARPS